MSDDSTGVKSIVLDKDKRLEMAKEILAKVGDDMSKLPDQLQVAHANAIEIDPNLTSASMEEQLSEAIAVALDTQMMSEEDINSFLGM